MKRNLLILQILCTMVVHNAWAQTDLACTAPQLTVQLPNYRCTATAATSGTNVGATHSPTTGSYPVPVSCVGGSGGNGGYTAPGTAGGDVWYKFVAPYTTNSTNTLTIDVTSGTLTDMAMAIYTASDPCTPSTFTQVTCSRDRNGTNFMPLVTFNGTNIATGGQTYYIRLWDEGGNDAGNFNILISSMKSEKIIDGASQVINVTEGYPIFFTDSGVPTGGVTSDQTDCNIQQPYQNDEDGSITFVAPAGKAINVSFQVTAYPSAGSCTSPGNMMLSINNRVDGNDYLYIYDGAVGTNPIGTYSGVTEAVPQPGTITSSGDRLSFRFVSDGSGAGNGWRAYVSVVDLPTTNTTVNVPCGSTVTFTDGASNITAGMDQIYTYCPSTVGSCLNADFTSVGFDYYIDQMKVYDGNSVSAPLIGTFTGSTNTGNTNILQNIRATTANTTGCLTFRFTAGDNFDYPYCISDALVGSTWQARSGWSADITCSTACRLENGNNECSTATVLDANGDYAVYNVNATGTPNISDPLFGSPATANVSGSTCTGGNVINRLEDNLWYKFAVPTNVDCGTATYNIQFNNISCQHLGSGSSGYQFVLFETSSCLSGTAWNGSSVLKYCADKLTGGASVNISPYITLGKTYYIMIDGFTGQHCNADLKFEVSGILNPQDCLLPIFLVDFDGKEVNNAVELSWTTENEKNNKGFYLQRSVGNAENFEDIAWIDSKIIETGGADYVYLDRDYNKSRISYYRLRQMDNDGKDHLHKIITFNPNKNGIIATVKPNPTNGLFTLEMTDLVEDNYIIEIMDVTGKIIERHEEENTFTNFMKQFDLSNYESGMYLIKISNSSSQETIKLLKK